MTIIFFIAEIVKSYKYSSTFRGGSGLIRGVVLGSGARWTAGSTRGVDGGSTRSLDATGAGRLVGGIDISDVTTCTPAINNSLYFYYPLSARLRNLARNSFFVIR